MKKVFLTSMIIILIISVLSLKGRAEYQFKTEKKYFDFEFNGQTYQLLGIRDIEYQKRFQTPAVPVVLAVTDSSGKLIQDKELISKGLIVADITGIDNTFNDYRQKLKTQRELFESTLNGEIAINWIERIGIILAPKAAVAIGKTVLTGGAYVPQDLSAVRAGLIDMITDPDAYFKKISAEILKGSIKKLKEVETKIFQLQGKTGYNLTEVEELNRIAEKAIAQGYASWEMYKEIMGSAGKSIKKALISGAKQLSSELLFDADLGVKLGVKNLLTLTKVAKLIEDSGALTVFEQKYNKQMAVFESQKSDNIMQNKIERAMQLAKDIGSISDLSQTLQLPKETEKTAVSTQKVSKITDVESHDELLELSQNISEKRMQRLKGYASQPTAKEAGKDKLVKQGYDSFQPKTIGSSVPSTNLQQERRYGKEEETMPKSQLQLSLSPSGLYNQPLWNQAYELPQIYSDTFFKQGRVAEPMDSYMQTLYQAFQNRDWDRFMSVAETAYRTGYFNRWSNQLPSDFNEVAEFNFNAYHELRNGTSREEFNQLFDNEIKQYIGR